MVNKVKPHSHIGIHSYNYWCQKAMKIYVTMW